MSHDLGSVYLDNKVVAYFDYNGTVDVCESSLVDTAKEVKFREMPWRNCDCQKPPVKVVLYTRYGGGFHWPGTVCLDCRTILTGTMPYDNFPCQKKAEHQLFCTCLPERGRPGKFKRSFF